MSKMTSERWAQMSRKAKSKQLARNFWHFTSEHTCVCCQYKRLQQLRVCVCMRVRLRWRNAAMADGVEAADGRAHMWHVNFPKYAAWMLMPRRHKESANFVSDKHTHTQPKTRGPTADSRCEDARAAKIGVETLKSNQKLSEMYAWLAELTAWLARCRLWHVAFNSWRCRACCGIAGSCQRMSFSHTHTHQPTMVRK